VNVLYKFTFDITDLGSNLIIKSPSPVAAAAPALLSAYEPDPMIGESPTRLNTDTASLCFVLLAQVKWQI